MLLAGMYANVVYSPSLWTKLAQMVLSTLLAFALWQKVEDICPYLLDPVARPPRRISLADGMIAALAFFVLQRLYTVFLAVVMDESRSMQITIAYIFAGLTITFFALWSLSTEGMGKLFKTVFTLPGSGTQEKPSIQQSVINGVGWGAMAALVAFLYLHALNLFPQWQVWKRDAELSSFLTRSDKPVWICILLVVAAPLFEEFLFRGLIFQGLRRSTGPALAVLGSAAVFAIIHPPIAILPVFGLGLAAAISFQRSRLLLAPMITHAVYNASIILFNKP
jgi:hypothetical protein